MFLVRQSNSHILKTIILHTYKKTLKLYTKNLKFLSNNYLNF